MKYPAFLKHIHSGLVVETGTRLVVVAGEEYQVGVRAIPPY